jgi:Leucine-rich repeat (LRR) protein
LNTNIERLWIPYNKIKILVVNKNLKMLSAPYNELEVINVTGNTELLELKVRQNFISDISNLSALTKLEILDLSYNPLGSLKVSSFSRMSDLTKLNLENTNITQKSLVFGTFAHNVNLTHLDLSYNQLNRLDFNIFTALTQLTHLKIDGNNLTEIPFENIKLSFPKLSLISLVDNDWNCSYLSNMIKQLRSLNVIVYVFVKFRVYDEMNVDGIRCHNNNTQHSYWTKSIVHEDDDEAPIGDIPSEPDSPLTVVKSNFTKVWNKISELQYFMSRLKADLNDQRITSGPNRQELKGIEPLNDTQGVVQSEVGSIKVILCLMFLIMMFFALVSIIKYLKAYASQQSFYYPSTSFRQSTATLQTTMENVM